MRARLLSGVVLILLVAATLLCYRPTPPPVMLLSTADGFGPARASWLNRGKAALPMWVWRAKQRLFGSPTQVSLEAFIVDLSDRMDSVYADAGLPRPALGATNGVQAWILGDPESIAVRHRLLLDPTRKMLLQARMLTADGIEGTLLSVQHVNIPGIPTEVGLQIRFLPRVRRTSTDLTTALVLTEAVTNASPGAVLLPATNMVSVRTNLTLAARVQLRDGQGVFLLCPDGSRTNRRNIGVFISATPKR